MEGLFTIQNLAIIVALVVPMILWCCLRVGAQSEVIAAAQWAARFEKQPPEQEG